MPFAKNLSAVSILVLIAGVSGCASSTAVDSSSLATTPDTEDTTATAPDSSPNPTAPDPDLAATVELRLPEWSTFSLGLRVLDTSQWARTADGKSSTYTIEAGVRRLGLYCAYRERTTTLFGAPGPVNPRMAEVTMEVALAAKRQYTVRGSFVDTRCVPRIRDDSGISIGEVVEAKDSYDLLRDMDIFLRTRPTIQKKRP
jgi:hypothetical protein